MKLKNLAMGLMSVALLASACTSQKEPATAAVAAAESALAEIKDDAARFLPEELQGVDTALASMKETLAKGDYKAVVASAPALTSSLDALKRNVAVKLDESRVAMVEWNNYVNELPGMVTALQARVDALTKAKRLPKGMDATALAGVTSGLESMKAKWTEASTAFSGGNAITAVGLAREAKAQGNTLMENLGMGAG